MVNSIQDNNDQEDHDISYRESQSQISGLSKKSQKISKNSRKTTQHNVNWSNGRPGGSGGNERNYELQLSEENRYLLKNQWFGNALSEKIIIFLCGLGTMKLKVRTGKPAAQAKENFKNQLQPQAFKEAKKFKKEYRKLIEKKIICILEYLGYPQDKTFFFVENNKNQITQHSLSDSVPQDIKQLLQIIFQSTSETFIPTLKLIIEIYFQNQNSNLDDIIQNIVTQLKNNKETHKMIFDFQLIKFLMQENYEIMSEIENDPSKAYEHLRLRPKPDIPNFSSNYFNDLQSAIVDQSEWIIQIVSDLIHILKEVI